MNEKLSVNQAEDEQVDRFQEQYDALQSAYYNIIAGVEEEVPRSKTDPRKSRPQRLLEVQDELARLCMAHGDFRRSLDHYTSILEWIDQHTAPTTSNNASESADEQPGTTETVPPPPLLPVEVKNALPELKITTMTNMATVHHWLGDKKTAITQLISAKKLLRELATPTENEDAMTKRRTQLEAIVTVNYSALLLSQGSNDDAYAAAEKALQLSDTSDSIAVAGRVNVIALGVLSSCERSKGELRLSQDYAFQAIQGLAPHKAEDGPALYARSHNNAGLHCFNAKDYSSAISQFVSAFRAMMHAKPEDLKTKAIVLLNLGRTLEELDTTATIPNPKGGRDISIGAHQCFDMASEMISAGGIVDLELDAVIEASRGELGYHAQDLTGAKSHFENSLSRLNGTDAVGSHIKTAPPSRAETSKIQAFTDSYLGSVLLMNGTMDLSEEAYQRDLELALETEDINSQLRALRNLAVLYSTTQRYHEAITLWRETLEIAAVLKSKHDLLIGYLGLGTTIKELTIFDHGKGEFQDVVDADENRLRPIFLKARALAFELGDTLRQCIAQRGVVGTYEWQPNSDELEQRLEESDTYVRLSEQCPDPQFQAGAYRSLANAINVQVARLAERGQRFAEAIKVLKFKRNSILQKFRDVASTAPSYRAPRPPVDRVDVLQRS